MNTVRIHEHFDVEFSEICLRKPYCAAFSYALVSTNRLFS